MELKYAIVEVPGEKETQIRVVKKNQPYESLFHEDKNLVAAGKLHCEKNPHDEHPLSLKLDTEHGSACRGCGAYERFVRPAFEKVLEGSVFTLDYWPGLKS